MTHTEVHNGSLLKIEEAVNDIVIGLRLLIPSEGDAGLQTCSLESSLLLAAVAGSELHALRGVQVLMCLLTIDCSR